VPDAGGGDDRQQFLDRSFEFLKHVTTLGTAAALLILAIYREAPFQRFLLAVTLILLGLCVVISVYGMQLIALSSLKPPPSQTIMSEERQDAIVRRLTATSGTLFIAAVIGFALTVLYVPIWPAVAVLLALILGLPLSTMRRRRA
jgi:hypothetical protein